MEIAIIAARADNGTIGVGAKIPWYLPDDVNRFKHITKYHYVVVGRKTYDTMPCIFDEANCIFIVLTRNENYAARPGDKVAHSVDEAIEMAEIAERMFLFVAGGKSVYEAFMERATIILLTEVHMNVAGDVRMPKIAFEEWNEIHRTYRKEYSFVELNRIRRPEKIEEECT